MNIPQGLLLTYKQVSNIFGVEVSVIERWVRQGKLKATKTPKGKHKISIEEVGRMLESINSARVKL